MVETLQKSIRKPTQVTDNEITPVFTKELNIKKGPFTMEELLKAVKSIKYGKACGLDEIPVEVWKLKEFHEILLECCNSVYQQEVISRYRKRMYTSVS